MQNEGPQHNEYLQNLLGEHSKSLGKTEKYTNDPVSSYEKLIQKGHYDIKEISPRIKKKKDAENEMAQSRFLPDEERKKFAEEMKKNRKEMEKKRSQKIKQHQEKTLEQKRREEDENKRKLEEELEKKREEISKRSTEKEQQKKKKQQETFYQNKLLKEKMKEKILLDKLNEKFRQTQIQNLQQRKKKLAEIRSLHKPISKEEFDEHLDRVQELKNQIVKPKKNKLPKNPKAKFYQSMWYRKQMEKKREYENERHEEDLYQIKQMKDKLKRYAEHVKKNHKPQMDPKLKSQREQKNKSVTIPHLTERELRQKGLRYLEYSKEQGDATKVSEDEGEIRKAFRYMNYLQEIRKNRSGDGVKSAHNFVEFVKSKKNLSEDQKSQKIREYIEGIERKAKMKEQIYTYNNILDEEVDHLYMKAISAKLSMLSKE